MAQKHFRSAAESAHLLPVNGKPHLRGTTGLMLGALGVVFGDIGTSPIYAFQQALIVSAGGNNSTREDVLGILSLVVWSLIFIVTVKYICFVLSADN